MPLTIACITGSGYVAGKAVDYMVTLIVMTVYRAIGIPLALLDARARPKVNPA